MRYMTIPAQVQSTSPRENTGNNNDAPCHVSSGLSGRSVSTYPSSDTVVTIQVKILHCAIILKRIKMIKKDVR